MPTELGKRLGEADATIVIEGTHRNGWVSTCSICGAHDTKPKYWVRALTQFTNHPTQKYVGGGDIGGYICSRCLDKLPQDRISRDFRKEK